MVATVSSFRKSHSGKVIFEYIIKQNVEELDDEPTFFRGATGVKSPQFNELRSHGQQYSGHLLDDFEKSPTNRVADLLTVFCRLLGKTERVKCNETSNEVYLANRIR